MATIDTDLLGLPIVALDSAMVVGELDGLLVDEAALRVAGFLVDLGLYECSVLRYDSVRAIGRDAVIVDDAGAITDISADPILEALALRDVAISESKAMTRSGRAVGTVGDFYVDTKTGDIIGIEVLVTDPAALRATIAVVPIGVIHKLGMDVVVLEDDYLEHLVPDGTALDDATPDRGAERPNDAGTTSMPPTDPTPIDEESPSVERASASPSQTHAHFLEGKTVLRRIESPSGELIAEAGDLVTLDMIGKARAADQLLILSLNVE